MVIMCFLRSCDVISIIFCRKFCFLFLRTRCYLMNGELLFNQNNKTYESNHQRDALTKLFQHEIIKGLKQTFFHIVSASAYPASDTLIISEPLQRLANGV